MRSDFSRAKLETKGKINKYLENLDIIPYPGKTSFK